MKEYELIQMAKKIALDGKNLDRKNIIRLLGIDPYSPVAEKLGDAAREVAAKVAKNQAGIWAAIGVDYKACQMNCDFCSLGARWNIAHNENEWNPDKIIQAANYFVSMGARWITLRTTQFYGLDKLIDIVRKIRTYVPGEYKIVVNTGEFDTDSANRLYDAGAQAAYHSLRLREGIHTKFTCEERRMTLQAVQDSPLELAYLVEPIGIEHTDDEVADVFLTAMEYGASICGAMGRVPVRGTPLGNLPLLSERRIAQIVAVIRLAGGFKCPDICVHPPSKLALKWGANVIVVETGSIPRCDEETSSEWNDFTMDTAKAWFEEAGYKNI